MDPRNVFVIHGRDLLARDAMVDFLRALNLNPIEWSQATRMTGSATIYWTDLRGCFRAGTGGGRAVHGRR